MAVVAVDNIQPKRLPPTGGLCFIHIDTSMTGQTHRVFVDGVECVTLPVEMNYWIPFWAPAHAVGTVNAWVVSTDPNTTFTNSVAVEYFSGEKTKLFVSMSLDPVSPQYSRRPPASQSLSKLDGDLIDVTSTGASFGTGASRCVISLAPIAQYGNAYLQHQLNSGAARHVAHGQFFCDFGLRGVTKIPAATWTFRGAYGRQFASPASDLSGSPDKLCLYVWRPSTQAVVGRIFDHTRRSAPHPGGAFPATPYISSVHYIRQLVIDYEGAEVSGIEDGDVLIFEWWGTWETVLETSLGYIYLDGADEPTQHGLEVQQTLFRQRASLEASVDIFGGAEPGPGAPGYVMPTVICCT